MDERSDDIKDMEAAAPTKIDPPLPPLPRSLESARTKSKFSWQLLLLALAIGGAAKVFGPSWARMVFQAVGLGTVATLGAFWAAFAAGIILHEAGHLLAAVLQDFEVLGASLGPIRAVHFHGKWTFQFSGTLLSGSISAIPRENYAWRKRMLVVVAAGPGATLLSGIGAGLLLFSGEFGGWMNYFLASLTELSFFLFVLGLIPNGSKAQIRNDAQLCYSLFRNTVEAQGILLYHLVTQLGVSGMRPRDYPERVIRKLALGRSRPDMSLIYAHTIIIWAIDRGDMQTADAWEHRAMDLCERCDLRLQNLTLARSAFYDVLFRDNLIAARGKFAEVDMEVLSPRYLIHRTKAAYQLAAGNIEEALAEIHRAQFSFPKHLPYYDFERTLLGQLHRKAIQVAELRRSALFAQSGGESPAPARRMSDSLSG
ncbi:MAG: site-2 protease family protein [Bryobacteraceae bacterium]